jgi:hypothetical protein
VRVHWEGYNGHTYLEFELTIVHKLDRAQSQDQSVIIIHAIARRELQENGSVVRVRWEGYYGHTYLEFEHTARTRSCTKSRLVGDHRQVLGGSHTRDRALRASRERVGCESALGEEGGSPDEGSRSWRLDTFDATDIDATRCSS